MDDGNLTDKEYVALAEVLALLASWGVKKPTRRTWDRWHQQRIGPPRIVIGRQILYKVSELRAWLDRHTEGRPREERRRRRG